MNDQLIITIPNWVITVIAIWFLVSISNEFQLIYLRYLQYRIKKIEIHLKRLKLKKMVEEEEK